jgi:hypothetical protein
VIKSKKNEYTQEEQTQSAKQIRISMEKNAGSTFLPLKRSNIKRVSSFTESVKRSGASLG